MSIFRKVSKRIDLYMQSNGFCRTETTFYRISNNIVYCIGFDIPSELLYVTAYIMPLYMPSEYRYYTYGNRLNAIQSIQLPILNKNDNEATIDTWCHTLCESIESQVLPFFAEVDTPNKLMQYVNSHACVSTEPLACHNVYICRLKMYTYLYIGDYANAAKTIASYRQMLPNITFLSSTILRKYSEEIDEVESLIQKGAESVDEYCSGVISNSKRILL